MIDVPEAGRRPRHRKTCPHCEATPAGCDSNYWLRAVRCCPMFTGEHDHLKENR